MDPSPLPTSAPTVFAGLGRAARTLNAAPHDDRNVQHFAQLLHAAERVGTFGDPLVSTVGLHVLRAPLTWATVARFRRTKITTSAWYRRAQREIFALPGYDLCRVSWLKAALYDDPDYFVPPIATYVVEALEGAPVLDDALIDRLLSAWTMTDASVFRDRGPEGPFGAFLLAHAGERVYALNWAED